MAHPAMYVYEGTDSSSIGLRKFEYNAGNSTWEQDNTFTGGELALSFCYDTNEDVLYTRSCGSIPSIYTFITIFISIIKII